METKPHIIQKLKGYVEDANENVFLPFVISAHTAFKELEMPFDYQHWIAVRQGVGHWTLICTKEKEVEIYRQSVDICEDMDERRLKYCFEIINERLIYISLKKFHYQDEKFAKISWIIK